MKYIVIVDKDCYITTLELNLKDGIEIPDGLIESNDINCYKFIDGEFIFDEEKKHRLEVEAEQRHEEELLKPTVDDLAEALDILTGIVLGE